MRTFTNKEAVSVLGCTVRTFQRWRRVYALRPVDFTGKVPLFSAAQLKRIKRLHDEAMERNRKAGRG